MSLTDAQLALKALQYRKRTLQIIKHAGAGHTGGSLSCTDILNVLYNRVLRVSPQTFKDPSRDRYIQSKGHSVEALFTVLADRGFFPDAELETLCQYRSHFVGHPTRKVPGVEQNTGALGHGLPIAAGVAIAGKKDRADFRVFVLLGDGELAEGSNWEAAMAAAHYDLDNLVAIVDHNTLQITGRTRDVCSNEPLDEKFRAFGWEVRTVDGHSISDLTAALSGQKGVGGQKGVRPLYDRDVSAQTDKEVDKMGSDPFLSVKGHFMPEPTDALTRRPEGKPLCVIANTTKGKGVSFMEDVVKWHHGVPSDEEFDRAIRELDAGIAACEKEGA